MRQLGHLMLDPKSKRSAGVPVTTSVHRALKAGNRARDRRDWAAAATAYRVGLQRDPELAHIWVQLGHALKEQGLAIEASLAYAHAVTLRPDDLETHLHLGHLAQNADDTVKAAGHFADVLRLDSDSLEAALAIERILSSAKRQTRAELIEVIRIRLDPADEVETPRYGRASITYDVSDLIAYFPHARLPTGIQRVQIQVITHALRNGDAGVRLCCFVDGQETWLNVPVPSLLRLTTLSLSGGSRDDPAWTEALMLMHLRLKVAGPIAFAPGSVMVNLGASWQLPNHFLFVREAKARYAIRYVPFVHDMIAITAPEHFTKGARREVVAWASTLFRHADAFLVNSKATRADLIRVGAFLGHTLDHDDIAVIPLDADFRTPAVAAVPRDGLAKWRLDRDPFVLLVSTVEPRKGHAIALDAWLTLIERHGPLIPTLVCVGKKGWLSDSVYDRLTKHPALAGRVLMLSGVADDELASLYRHCLFTIYPSLYEGWGLPITEALSYAKPVIAADTSSLPEAGGDFAVYVAPNSPSALAAAVERMTMDVPYREALARKIATGFEARSWATIADQIVHELARMASRRDRDDAPGIPCARLAAYHSLARGTALRLWPGAGSGEIFRAGLGWHAPGLDASWTRPAGGDLAIGVPAGAKLRVGLLLMGAPDRDLDWWVIVNEGSCRSGILRHGRRRWVTFTHMAGGNSSDLLRLRIRAELMDADERRDQDQECNSIGLAGFFIYLDEDVAAGERLREAILLDDLDSVDAYREQKPRKAGTKHGVLAFVAGFEE